MRVILLVHTFLLVLPVCLGHPQASGRGSPDQSCFSGGTGTGCHLNHKMAVLNHNVAADYDDDNNNHLT